jgi:hypothetical protein
MRSAVSDRNVRILGGLILLALACGCLILMIGIPLAVIQAIGMVTQVPSQQLVLGLVGVPLVMALWSLVLIWLNDVYLRATGVRARWEREGGAPKRVRGPLEPLLMVSFLVALVFFVIWFLTTASNPPRSVI